MMLGISEMVSARALQTFAIVFSTPKVGISGAYAWKEATF